MKKTSVTLVELIISLILLSIIVLGAIAFSIVTTEFLGSSERKSEILNDLTFLLDHIQKHVLYGIGDQTNVTLNPLTSTMAVFVQSLGSNSFRVRIRQDIPDTLSHAQFTYNSAVRNPTPWDYSDDRFVVYEFNPTNAAYLGIPAHSIQVRACPVTAPLPGAAPIGAGCTGTEVLTAQLVSLANVTETNGGLYIQNLILCYNTALYNPAAPDERIFPTISVDQQFFYNYTQSLNY